MEDRSGLVVSPAATGSTAEFDVPPSVEGPDPLKGGDVYEWAMNQAALIRARRFDEIDWINVADEIESVGKSEVRSLGSHIEIVLVHLLKWDYQADKRTRSWMFSVREHRRRIARDLGENPSLKSRFAELVSTNYDYARFRAANETGLSLSRFPEKCPYDPEALMTLPVIFDQTDEAS